jgi:tRNA-splicing ligase RtcB
MYTTLKGKTVDARIWLPIEEVESKALEQIRDIASLPWVAHVAAMADCHWGIGATVGSVIAMRGAVAPAAVGVDIGCGMAAVKTNLKASQLPDSLAALRHDLEREIPVGHYDHGDKDTSKRVHHKIEAKVVAIANELANEFPTLTTAVQSLEGRARKQIGTLGGGNHFIELCLADSDATRGGDQDVWMMLHSGSRNIGKSLAEHHMAIAKKLDHNEALENKDLAVFLANTPEMQAYRRDLYWAQRYAMANRMTMLGLYMRVMQNHFPQVEFNEEPILCHHNYVSEENHFGEDLFVTRKGAIRARKDDMGIIPGSMGTRSYIVRGKESADSLHSASHGAGRRMSRGAARKTFKPEDVAEVLQGVECRKDAGIIDELPGAYKDIERVMKAQEDLVEVVAVLKQVLVVKG